MKFATLWLKVTGGQTVLNRSGLLWSITLAAIG